MIKNLLILAVFTGLSVPAYWKIKEIWFQPPPIVRDPAKEGRMKTRKLLAESFERSVKALIDQREKNPPSTKYDAERRQREIDSLLKKAQEARSRTD